MKTICVLFDAQCCLKSFAVVQTTVCIKKLNSISNKMPLLMIDVNTTAIVIAFKHSDVMVLLLRMAESASFRVIFILAVVFHVSESFTGDCKY